MKFKLDENLPVELVSDFVQIGHEVHTVFEEELTGAANRVILQAAHNEGRILLTLDKGIASIRDYPPELLSGIVLFRPEASGRGAVLHFIRERLSEVLELEPHARLIVVGPSRIRIR